MIVGRQTDRPKRRPRRNARIARVNVFDLLNNDATETSSATGAPAEQGEADAPTDGGAPSASQTWIPSSIDELIARVMAPPRIDAAVLLDGAVLDFCASLPEVPDFAQLRLKLAVTERRARRAVPQ
jgi:hypothetical protein